MTELLLGKDVEEQEAGIKEFLARAVPIGRFKWVDDGDNHFLIRTQDSRANLYAVKTQSPFARSFLMNQFADKPLDPRDYIQLDNFRISYDNRDDMMDTSLADIVARLPSLEVIKGRLNAFQVGIAYHIGNQLVSDVALYSKRQ
jgi:hypothetical protein